MARPKTEYKTFIWRGRRIKRRVLSKAADAERVRKMLASKAAKRAAVAGLVIRRNGGVREPKLNGPSPTLLARVNDALVYLERARKWLATQYPTTEAYQDHLKKDPGHFNAMLAEATLRNG